MCYRRSFSRLGFALLCVLGTTVSANAGSIGYEALDGARCRVSTDTPSSLNMQSGYTEDLGANVSFGLTIPLSDPTTAARTNCVKFAEQDQARQHFTWLLDMYEQGVITREALEKEAAKLGMTLAPEQAMEGPQTSAVIIR